MTGSPHIVEINKSREFKLWRGAVYFLTFYVLDDTARGVSIRPCRISVAVATAQAVCLGIHFYRLSRAMHSSVANRLHYVLPLGIFFF